MAKRAKGKPTARAPKVPGGWRLPALTVALWKRIRKG